MCVYTRGDALGEFVKVSLRVCGSISVSFVVRCTLAGVSRWKSINLCAVGGCVCHRWMRVSSMDVCVIDGCVNYLSV